MKHVPELKTAAVLQGTTSKTQVVGETNHHTACGGLEMPSSKEPCLGSCWK